MTNIIILIIGLLCRRCSAAILVHHICIAADTAVGLSGVVETLGFEPRETQHRVLGDGARTGGSAALVHHTNRRRDPDGGRQARQPV
jgi:hypothetical protein